MTHTMCSPLYYMQVEIIYAVLGNTLMGKVQSGNPVSLRNIYQGLNMIYILM